MPYSDLDNEYAIMFQVGNGIPPVVSNDILKAEGKDFLQRCFQSEPTQRWTTSQLLEHSFLMVTWLPAKPSIHECYLNFLKSVQLKFVTICVTSFVTVKSEIVDTRVHKIKYISL